MPQKRYQTILFAVIVLLVIGTVAINLGPSRIYTVCGDTMLTIKGDGPWQYEYTNFSAGAKINKLAVLGIATIPA